MLSVRLFIDVGRRQPTVINRSLSDSQSFSRKCRAGQCCICCMFITSWCACTERLTLSIYLLGQGAQSGNKPICSAVTGIAVQSDCSVQVGSLLSTSLYQIMIGTQYNISCNEIALRRPYNVACDSMNPIIFSVKH